LAVGLARSFFGKISFAATPVKWPWARPEFRATKASGLVRCSFSDIVAMGISDGGLSRV